MRPTRRTINATRLKKTLRDHMCDKDIHSFGPRMPITIRIRKDAHITQPEQQRKDMAKEYKMSSTENNYLYFVKRFESKRRCTNCNRIVTVHHKEEHDKIKAKTKLQAASM